MAWLIRDGDVLASLELPATRRERARGLLGRSDIEGAMLLAPARSIHTFGMKFSIDVAYCDAGMVVIAVSNMPPHRLGVPRLRARSVIEASSGAFERWGLTIGQKLEVRQ